MAEKHCNSCGTQTLSRVTMSSADWQRNEQRHENREKRFIWVIVLLICLLVGSNIGWLIYESQFETVESTKEEFKHCWPPQEVLYWTQQHQLYKFPFIHS